MMAPPEPLAVLGTHQMLLMPVLCAEVGRVDFCCFCLDCQGCDEILPGGDPSFSFLTSPASKLEGGFTEIYQS